MPVRDNRWFDLVRACPYTLSAEYMTADALDTYVHAQTQPPAWEFTAAQAPIMTHTDTSIM